MLLTHAWWLSVRVPEELRRYIAEKGSIALDGISLTVARWHDGVAENHNDFIPFTHQHTSVRTITAGNAINIKTNSLPNMSKAFWADSANQRANRASPSPAS